MASAGLRTGNIYSPYPEEINRKVTGAIAQLHFAPTEKAASNLKAEAVPADRIYITGNTVIDALLEVVERLENYPQQSAAFDAEFGIDPTKRLILVTGHRRESSGEDFERICSALATIAKRGDVQIIYPVHLNPNVKGPVETSLSAFDRAAGLLALCPPDAPRRHHPDRLGRGPRRSAVARQAGSGDA